MIHPPAGPQDQITNLAKCGHPSRPVVCTSSSVVRGFIANKNTKMRVCLCLCDLVSWASISVRISRVRDEISLIQWGMTKRKRRGCFVRLLRERDMSVCVLYVCTGLLGDQMWRCGERVAVRWWSYLQVPILKGSGNMWVFVISTWRGYRFRTVIKADKVWMLWHCCFQGISLLDYVGQHIDLRHIAFSGAVKFYLSFLGVSLHTDSVGWCQLFCLHIVHPMKSSS